MIRQKLHSFFTTVSIPGISRVVGTEVLVLRLLWIAFILGSMSFGLFNIAQSVKDYYRYDVITNVEYITPESFTLPAITICAQDKFDRAYYYNNETLISQENDIKNDRLILKDFLSLVDIFPGDYEYNMSKLESFKILYSPGNLHLAFSYFENLQCVRFNGASNKELVLTSLNGTSQQLTITLKRDFREDLGDKYIIYSLFPSFYVFIGDNYLDSFINFDPLLDNVEFGYFYDILYKKSLIEDKLGEPYNQCRESKKDQPYRIENCIEPCIIRMIEEKYNCTQFSFKYTDKVRICENLNSILTYEFYDFCKNECPVECDKITFVTDFEKISYTEEKSMFTITVPDFSSLKITQIPKMNGFHFLSNIGGSLGLFMGISFLNSVEFLCIIIDVFSVVFIH